LNSEERLIAITKTKDHLAICSSYMGTFENTAMVEAQISFLVEEKLKFWSSTKAN